MSKKLEMTSVYFLRFALAAGFLSAVADRFGFWGQSGSPHVAWGSFENFMNYTATLNWFIPVSLIPAVAWIATILEFILAIFLIVGFKIKETAFASGILLALFFLTMTISSSIKAPLDYSVFTSSAASFLLACFYNQKQKTT